MTGFVGVPIRVGQEVFGNLYLTERSDRRRVHPRRRGAGHRARRGRRCGHRERTAVHRIRAAPPVADRVRRADAASAVRRRGKSPHPDRRTRRSRCGSRLRCRGGAARPGPNDRDRSKRSTRHGSADTTAPVVGSLAGQAILTGKGSLVTGEQCEAAAAVLGADLGPLIVVPLTAGEQVRGALILGGRRASPDSPRRIS